MTEYLPVTVNINAAEGCDFMLFSLAESLHVSLPSYFRRDGLLASSTLTAFRFRPECRHHHRGKDRPHSFLTSV